MARYGIVYLIENTVTGKGYVGVTTGPLRRRWTEHVSAARRRQRSQKLQNSIRKHGPEAFEISALESFSSKGEMLAAEIRWIAELDTYKSGYNVTLGGENPPSSKGKRRPRGAVEKTAAAHRGMKRSAETCAKISAATKGNGKGKPKSDEMRAKLSAARKGMKFSAETRAKISAAQRNRSQAHRDKQSAAHKITAQRRKRGPDGRFL